MTQHFVFESVPGYSPIHDDRERIKEPVAAGKIKGMKGWFGL